MSVFKWIPISERLPERSERVLLFTPYPFFGNDYACVGNQESITTCIADINSEKVPVFTHWMPLPPKPQIPS